MSLIGFDYDIDESRNRFRISREIRLIAGEVLARDLLLAEIVLSRYFRMLY